MKRIVCAVLAAALAYGLCGCAKKEESSLQTSVPESAVEVANPKTTIRIYDETLTLPCKYKELKHITIDQQRKVDIDTENGIGYGFANYDDERFGIICIDNYNESGDNSENYVVEIEVDSHKMNSESAIEYMGFSFASSVQDVKNVFGEPEEEEFEEAGGHMIYRLGEDNDWLVRIYFLFDKITKITIKAF